MIGEAVSRSSQRMQPSSSSSSSSKFGMNKLTMAMRRRATVQAATCHRRVFMVVSMLLVLQIDSRQICRVIVVLAALQHLVFVIKTTTSFRVIKKVLDSDNSGSCLLF